MIKLSWMMCVRALSTVFLFFSVISVSMAAKYSIKTDIVGNVIYNDNVLLAESDKDAATSTQIMPKAEISISDNNWVSKLDLSVRSNNYANNSLDSLEQKYSLSGSYLAEKSTFGVGLAYNVTSSLNPESTEFGLIDRKVEKATASFSPQYTLLATERFSISLAYNLVDVTYDEIVNVNLVEYQTSTPSISFKYNTTERSKVNINFSSTNYTRDDGKSGYDTFVSQIGLDYQFSQTLGGKISIGSSDRNSIDEVLVPVTIFNGTTVSQVTEVESQSDSLVYDIAVNQNIYRGSINYQLSKSDSAGSFGNLTEVNKSSIQLNQKISDWWNYSVKLLYRETKNIGQSVDASDSRTLSFMPKITYMLDRKLHLTASYEYAGVEKVSQAGTTSPVSNKLNIGLVYRFDEFSTY